MTSSGDNTQAPLQADANAPQASNGNPESQAPPRGRINIQTFSHSQNLFLSGGEITNALSVTTRNITEGADGTQYIEESVATLAEQAVENKDVHLSMFSGLNGGVITGGVYTNARHVKTTTVTRAQPPAGQNWNGNSQA